MVFLLLLEFLHIDVWYVTFHLRLNDDTQFSFDIWRRNKNVHSVLKGLKHVDDQEVQEIQGLLYHHHV